MISTSLHPTLDFTSGMHAIVTGSGSALPDPARAGAGVAVVVDGTVLQFDCGRNTTSSLCRSNINPLDIDHLFLTHLHFDHVAEYGYLLMSSWIAGRDDVLQVWGPSGVRTFSERTVGAHAVDATFFEHIVDTWPSGPSKPPRRALPATVTEIDKLGTVLATDTVQVRVSETPHYRDMGVINLAYRVDCAYGSVVVTGDGRPSQQVIDLADAADLLVHECAKPDPGMIEGGKFSDSNEGYDLTPSRRWAGGHTTPTWLGEAAAAARVKTVVATHLAPLSSGPAATQMSRLFTGGVEHGDEIWNEYHNRIRASFDGDIAIAKDGMIFGISPSGVELFTDKEAEHS